MKPLNSDMMVGKSAFKQIQEKEINSKYPLLEKNIPKLFNAGHFDHFYRTRVRSLAMLVTH